MFLALAMAVLLIPVLQHVVKKIQQVKSHVGILCRGKILEKMPQKKQFRNKKIRRAVE